MLLLRHHLKGETLAETIIALLIMAIGITFSGTILASSLGNISSSKSRVIAVNIAREGIEAMRNIRDTNWLRFSGNRRDCWNHLPGPLVDDEEACDGTTPLIESGDYMVYKDFSQRWRLQPPDSAFDNRQLYLMDIDPLKDTNGDRNAENDEDIYNHRITFDNSSAPLLEDNPLGYNRSKPTIYKRQISINYLDNAGNALPAGAPVTTAYNRMVVTSVVTWVASGRALSVTLITHLTDYLGRDNFES